MELTQDRAVNIDEQRVATGQSATASQRKLNANRQNAKKSTGPRTPRGKAYSRKNAIKHGLFTRHLMDFLMLGETQAEYDRLLDDLHKQFEPVGRAEELEVERITVCWWKFQRAWRYENSADHIKLVRAAQEIKQLEKSCQARNQEREAIILGLENMLGELSVVRELPPDLKNRFFVLTSTNEQAWQEFEAIADEDLKARASRNPELASFLSSPKARRERLALLTLGAAKRSYELELELVPSDIKICVGQYTIPSCDDLDKILRYDSANDRNLGRAYDRLERLQRRRKGESVLPPVSVQLTQ